MLPREPDSCSTNMELAFRRIGDGPKRALLVHGLSSNGAGWWRVAPRLAALGYVVTIPDLRGHGASADAKSYGFADHAADLFELGTDWDMAMGHSLGGSTLLVCTAQDPNFAKRLVLEDPGLDIPATAESAAWLTSAFDGEPTIEAVAAAHPRWHPEDCRIKVEARQQTSRHVAIATVADNNPWNLMEEMLGVAVPSLLLGADPRHDALVSPEIGRQLAAANGCIQFSTIDGSSHSIHRDEFDACMRTVESFLL